MKTVFRLTLLSMLLGLAVTTFTTTARADTTPDEMHISCTAPNPEHQTGLHRPKGDGNIWTFSIVLDGNAHFVKGPFWNYPGKDGNDPDWGLVTGGADKDSSMSWSSPGETGDFQVRVNGQISCGDGGDGAPIDFSAGWDGKVEFNAEIKVKRSGSEDDYSSSATVAAGGLGSSEHKADVQVIATDDDGNPMEGISVDAPTIQDGDGVSADAGISPSSATTDSEGKANFTFTSSDIVKTVTLEEDGGESSATATIDQSWTQIDNEEQSDSNTDHYSWVFDKYFDYNVASDVTFVMSLNNKSPGATGSIPIAGHTISFETTQVSGWEWDPTAGEDWDGDGLVDGDYGPLTLQDYHTVKSKYGDLAPNVAASEGSPGSYTGQQTVHSNSGFLVDTVYFDAVDYNADDGQ